jgi:hypothetical protein
MRLLPQRKVRIKVHRKADGKKICTIKLSQAELETIMITATAAGLSLEEFFSSALENTKNNS